VVDQLGSSPVLRRRWVVGESSPDGVRQRQLALRHELADGGLRERLVDRSDVEARGHRVRDTLRAIGQAIRALEHPRAVFRNEDRSGERVCGDQGAM
jgi:hypothetical protein